MPKKKAVKYIVNPDDSITILDVPTKEGKIEVVVRPVEYEDEQTFARSQNDLLANYKFVASLITKWGDKEGAEIDGEIKSPVTALELKANGRAMKVLDGCIDACFLEVVEPIEVTQR